MKDKILVIGASGQIGIELTIKLRETYSSSNVIASDIKIPPYEVLEGGPFELLDILDYDQLNEVVIKHSITHIYQLAALLSVTSEQHVSFAWKLNINGLLNVLELAKRSRLSHSLSNNKTNKQKQRAIKIFWPSSIAVFGPNTPIKNTPQYTITEPNTVYGISKLTGERWCEYYHRKFGVDVRSIRYPGLIGHESSPGGGTTDYAVHMFFEAIKKNAYTCFLEENTILPMMYMLDGIKAIMNLMETDEKNITVRSSYNIFAMSFSPGELANEIKKHIPGFKCSYKPDYRQQLADSWPKSIDDKHARNDWGWLPEYEIKKMTDDMFRHLKPVRR